MKSLTEQLDAYAAYHHDLRARSQGPVELLSFR